jgi:sortase A
MNRAALAVACLVTLAGCGSSRASIAPPTVATTSPVPTTADSPTAGVGAPPLPATTTTSTTTAPNSTSATAAPTTTVPPVPVRAPADNAKEPLRAIGDIFIARLGLDSTLYEGVTLGTLNNGPGHWPGSAMPGQPGNVVVAGHRVSHGRQSATSTAWSRGTRSSSPSTGSAACTS